MSEIDYLIKQLEYSFNTKNKEKADLIVRELIKMRAKIKIDFKIKYECSSHSQRFKQKQFSQNLDNMYHFEICNHYVCKECIQAYIIENFERYEANFKYTCPGCYALGAKDQTLLDYTKNYFTEVIPLKKYEKSLWDRQVSLSNAISLRMFKECFFTQKNSYNIACPKIFNSGSFSKCSHAMCCDCAIQFIQIHWAKLEDKVLKCPSELCDGLVDHEFIEKICLNSGLDDPNNLYVFLKLDVPKNKYFCCKICNALNGFAKSEKLGKCRSCNFALCSNCGNAVHNNKPCFAVINNINEYRNFDCKQDHEIEEFKLKYFHAVSLLEWDLHAKTAPKMLQLHNYKFQVTKVAYLYNPDLIERFEAAKEIIRQRGGDTTEIFVYHASRTENIDKICKNGFLIGGIDIPALIGNKFGYGVYAASDATLSISYFLKEKVKHEWIFICKAVRGIETRSPINDKNELLATTYNSIMIDGQGQKSHIYVFFQKEIIIPYYLVHFN